MTIELVVYSWVKLWPYSWHLHCSPCSLFTVHCHSVVRFFIQLMKENDLHLFKWSAFELHKTKDVLQCVSVIQLRLSFRSFRFRSLITLRSFVGAEFIIVYLQVAGNGTTKANGKRQQWNDKRCQMHYMDSLMATKLWMNCLKCEMQFIIIIIITIALDRVCVFVCVWCTSRTG